MTSKIKNLNFQSTIVNKLSTLTSSSIFKFFFIFFVIGSISIYFDWYAIYASSACVIFYSLLLIIAQNKYYVSLSQESKDSPYFIGFLFTYVAILNIFFRLSDDNVQITFLVSQIGSKLLTTILGLIARQYLISSDPVTDHHNRIFQQATEELKENVAAYRIAQEKLINLIDNFTSKQEEVMLHVHDASVEHLSALTESTNALTKLSRQYPPKIKNLLSGLDEVVVKIEEVAKKTIPELNDSFRDKINSRIENEYTNFNLMIENISKRIDDQVISISTKVDNLDSVIGNLSVQFTKCNNILSDGIIIRLKEIENKLNDTVGIINNGHQSTELIKDATLVFLNNINDQISKIDKSVTELNDTNINRIRLFSQEINAIDSLIDQFIETTKRRLN